MTKRTPVRLSKRKPAEGCVQRVVSETPAVARGRRLPHVSSATGGFAPGIRDLRDLAELEDLEYAQRLKRS